MADVGINLTMTENVSSVAPKVSEALRGISQTGEDMKDALELGDLEQKYKAFADRTDKIYDMQRAKQVPAGAQEVARGKVTGKPEQIMRGVGGITQRLGATGDPIEAAPAFADILKGIIGSIGPAGIILGVAAGGLMITNALSKQYEKVMPEMMDLTAIMGEFGETSKETSKSFRETMSEASAAAAEFGYSLEEGAGVMKTFAEVAGMGRDEALAGTERVLAYARGYGVTPGALGRPEAVGRRFGQSDILGYAAGGLQASGMGKGQYQEFLNATLSIFEEGISRGVIKAIPEIASTQAWIAQMGEVYKGQYGLSFYKKLEGVSTGAVSLETERDIVLYRAQQKVLGPEASELDIKMALEKEGFSPELMKATWEGIQKETAGGMDAIRRIGEIFQINTTQSKELMDFLESGEFGKGIEIIQPPDAASKELTLLQLQENMRDSLRIIGTGATDVKANTLSSAGSLLKLVAEVVTGENPPVSEVERKIFGWMPDIEGVLGGERKRNDPLWDFIFRLFKRQEENPQGFIGGASGELKGLVESINSNTEAIKTQTEEFKKPVEVEYLETQEEGTRR